ncbi:hypothetical protein GBF38_000474, partial [Nibea albiflora]
MDEGDDENGETDEHQATSGGKKKRESETQEAEEEEGEDDEAGITMTHRARLDDGPYGRGVGRSHMDGGMMQ